MNESILKSILEEYVERELSKYENAPEHKFSLKHRFAMKKIFKLYEKNTHSLRPEKHGMVITPKPRRLTLRTAIILATMIFLAAIAGCTAAYFLSQDFSGDVHREYTDIFPLNTENCLDTIQEKYYLSELPEGFEKFDSSSTPYYECVCFIDRSTSQTISLSQHVKSSFGRMHMNTENQQIEIIDIKGHEGLCIELEGEEQINSVVLWDNGDYILEVGANLPKSETINLAKTTKIIEN